MPRLYRPHIPVEVRCRVAMRQLGELWPDQALKDHEGGHGAFLVQLLKKLCELSGEEKLHLDHDPPLATRERVPLVGVRIERHRDFNSFGVPMEYDPDANDPDHLIYRGAQAHKIKTNVRGEHGQHPDRVLIKRERRRQRREFLKELGGPPMSAMVAAVSKPRKMKRPKRKAKIRSANRWPPKGSRKINWRSK